MCSKKSERIKLWLDECSFNTLVCALNYVNAVVDEQQDSLTYLDYLDIKAENRKLMNKIIQYGWYEENANKKEARIELFPSEARELICQLLHFVEIVIDEIEIDMQDNYDTLKQKHEAVKSGLLQLENILTVKQARELMEMCWGGAVYLVKNKDGKIYYVDHGFTELVKTDERWEDKEYGFEDVIGLVFTECNMKLDFVSWCDTEPTHIETFLKVKGFMKDDN